MTRVNRSILLGSLSIFLSATIFSTMEIVLKLPAVSGAFHPLQITMERFLIGGLCLLPVAAHGLRTRGETLTISDFRWFALTGFLNIPLAMVMFQMAVTQGQANVVAVIFSGNPVFTALLASLLLGESLRWNHLAALGCEIFGILMVLSPWRGTAVSFQSVGLALGAALGFSLYAVLSKKKTARLGSCTVICANFLFGAAELAVLLILGHTRAGMSLYSAMGLELFCDVPFFQGFYPSVLPYFFCICLVNSAAGYVFHMLAIELVGAIRGSLVFIIKPVLAPLLAWAILGEGITWSVASGVLCFLCSGLLGFLPEWLRAKRTHPLGQEIS